MVIYSELVIARVSHHLLFSTETKRQREERKSFLMKEGKASDVPYWKAVGMWKLAVG